MLLGSKEDRGPQASRLITILEAADDLNPLPDGVGLACVWSRVGL